MTTAEAALYQIEARMHRIALAHQSTPDGRRVGCKRKPPCYICEVHMAAFTALVPDRRYVLYSEPLIARESVRSEVAVALEVVRRVRGPAQLDRRFLEALVETAQNALALAEQQLASPDELPGATIDHPREDLHA